MVASKKIDLVTILGPTASGKSALALRIANQYPAEIITADSRTIYKYMDIGTAKPTAAEQVKIKHWGLDLIEPGQIYSAAQFKDYASQKIADIQARGKLPILVGGTGLYIDGVLFDFKFINGTSYSQRQKIEALEISELQKLNAELGYPLPENKNNKRHLTRNLERKGKVGGRRQAPRQGTLLIGLLPSDVEIKAAIDKRAEAMFRQGIIEETEQLIKKYGRDSILETGGIIYKVSIDYLDGKIDKNQAKELFKTADWQYARRQKTWFKRNKFIQWYNSSDQAYTSVKNLLNNKSSTTTT